MGQTSSTPRGQRQESHLRSALTPRTSNDGDPVGMNNEAMSRHSGENLPPRQGDPEPLDRSSIHRLNISSSSSSPSPSPSPSSSSSSSSPSPPPPPVSSSQNTVQPSVALGASDMMGTVPMRDYDQENRPLVGMGHQDHRAASISRLMARRQSTMSRLGSRILPNSVIRGLLSSQEETPAEGHAHRNGRLSRSIPRTEATHGGRFTPFSSLGSRGITRRRSIRGPYPLPRGDAALIPDSPPNPTYLDATAEPFSDSNRGGSWRRRARLNRVRHSLSAPISQIFGQQQSPPPSSQRPGTPPPRRPSRSALQEDSDRLLPSLGHMDTRMDFDDPPHELDSVEPAMRSARPLSPGSTRPAQGVSGIRRFPNVLRARSSRILRREEQTPLSRVLQLAAAAIAAQLSGGTGPVMPHIQSLGNDGLDGSLENFIQSLQQVTSTQANASGADEPPPPQPPDSNSNNNNNNNNTNTTASPVNFLRVFRFVNPDVTPRGPPAAGEPAGRPADRMDVDDPTDDGVEGRTVTLVVVGVRSVPSSNGGVGGDQHNTRVGLETWLGLPLVPPSHALPARSGPGSFFRRADGRSRFSPHRQMTGATNPFPANYESQRHQRPPASPWRPSDTGSGGLPSSLPAVLAESPPGPHPPPSTPAEPGLSRVSSGTTTPSRRPSSASAITPNILPQLYEEDPSSQPAVESAEEDPTSFASTRQRRRSDSEFARHRHLGAGAARRNGVVEPDHPAPSAGRTWLIYVVGTNLSENHPAFATPSLFTDNPTYEDMILLSSLLGPAKPPVASQEDITSAGGLFQLVEYAGSLVAEALNGSETVPIHQSERCLICLSDYEAADEVRQLAKCKHIYHKDCIDQWLTTGRNSCPLCRGQGVAESPNDEDNSNHAATQEAAG
ncbi:hypothetical protein Egran_05969 [Elaphomyces granulatus]|uniref:RING-type domain-containing protein n=1 Tax=Elaphomyces granulatus TaxID=519963 RepID=A0A232LQ19_9EURO|nr:hypothetical protein Egran_05969 [Elaphomyces granulatus]